MSKSLDTVPDEYFYQFLTARDGGKRKRLKVSFSSIIILITMSVANYFSILQIYCVNRFPTSEFTAPKIKKNKNRTSVGAL
jgi:hypothetical protein